MLLFTDFVSYIKCCCTSNKSKCTFPDNWFRDSFIRFRMNYFKYLIRQSSVACICSIDPLLLTSAILYRGWQLVSMNPPLSLVYLKQQERPYCSKVLSVKFGGHVLFSRSSKTLLEVSFLHLVAVISGGSRISQTGCQLKDTNLLFGQYSGKLHENEEKLAERILPCRSATG